MKRTEQAKQRIKLMNQWLRLLELPSAYSRFTTTLYESMYTRGSFIAHFNREGFFKARFQTLADFDHTLEMMAEVPELKRLIEYTPVSVLAETRYKIAAMEANIVSQQAKIMNQHVLNLQSRFSRPLIQQGGAQ